MLSPHDAPSSVGRSAASVLLVSMPWVSVESPSIQLGILHALLESQGIEVASYSGFLHFAEFLWTRCPGGEPFSASEYDNIVQQGWDDGIGEWVFSTSSTAEEDLGGADYHAFLRRQGTPESVISRIQAIKSLVPEFLDLTADHIASLAPKIVGFSSTYSQHLASIALARRLRDRLPTVKIVFGGANCSGPMGTALLRAFPFVDAVVDGEAERILPAYVRSVLAGDPAPSLPRLHTRSPSSPSAVALDPPLDMEASPIPNYDEYFETLESCSFWPHYEKSIKLPFETARGCWWGQKNHCTFCGLNGATMKFRAKPAARAVAELEHLARRYRVLDFDAVDNIVDLEYLRSFFPELSRSSLDVSMFYETKANLTRSQIATLRSSGVRLVQPGIESLDSSVLKLMKKGTTALQNIRFLKWCAEEKIQVAWNILVGFGNEDPDAYARMTTLCGALVHLCPPNAIPILASRFSPMFERPDEHGIELTGPLPHYDFLYPTLDAELRADLAYFFGHRHLDGRTLEYAEPLREAVVQWQRRSPQAFGRLTYRRGPGFVHIADRRFGETSDYVLEGVEAEIYSLCDAGLRPRALEKALAKDASAPTNEELMSFLLQLVDARLMCHVDGAFLSLALLDRRTTPVARNLLPLASTQRAAS